MENYLQIKNLSINYRKKEVVKNLNLTVSSGDIVAVVGLKDSGKSSIVKAIMSLKKFSGSISVLGENISNNVSYKNFIGYVPEDNLMFSGYSGLEYLVLVGGLMGLENNIVISRSRKLIEVFKLDTLINKRIIEYKTEDIQKLLIIASLINKPKILLLDEVTRNLDSYSIEVLKLILKIYKESGGAVIFTTSDLLDLTEVSSRVVILGKGQVFRDSSQEELKKEADSDSYLKEVLNKLTLKVNFEEIYLDLKEDLLCENERF